MPLMLHLELDCHISDLASMMIQSSKNFLIIDPAKL